MNRTDIENRVRQMSWPPPSPDLRRRVLSTAVVAEGAVTWSDRIWFSRGWRWAAAGVIGACAVLDYASTWPSLPVRSAAPQMVAEMKAAQAREETIARLLQEFSSVEGDQTR